ncbi:MAG: isoprenyl transferase [Fidelibacterota bacterium]
MISSDLENINSEKLPHHIAIIMDGNGRWAHERKLPRISGHNEGVRAVRRVTEAAGELGINTLTLFTFSSENWNRPSSEVSALMKLFIKSLRNEIDDLNQNNVRLKMIGCKKDLPSKVITELEMGIKSTSGNTGLTLNLAFNYGSRLEIVNAVKKISEKVKRGELNSDTIDEKVFEKFLYTNNLPDPDLLIRTGGEFRISNFMLWQIAYSEIIIYPKYWPEFSRQDLITCILNYQKRERRFGRISEQLKKDVIH